jgi:hypothetical protein
MRLVFVLVHLMTLVLVSFSLYAADASVMKAFNGEQYGYTISYPADWKVYDHKDGVVVFKTEESKGAYPTTVNIQTIYTTKAKGSYPTVKALMDDFEKNAKRHADAVKFLERHPITLVEPNGDKLVGEETTMLFKDHGKQLKQWQVMVMTTDGNLFQAWAYRAPEERFAITLPLAKKMLGSWDIE